ncbi:MAG: hypothetical protein CMJ83_15760 [Planctomycetes bacterium]|nr:hypothetical protein [Planctomycetota bacterium]
MAMIDGARRPVDNGAMAGLIDEIGHDHGRLRPPIVVLLFALLCAGTGLIDLLWPVPFPTLLGWEAREWREREDSARWRDGTTMRLWETYFNRTSRVRKVVLPPWSMLRYRFARDAGDRVVAGNDGFLFMRSYVAWPEDDPRALVPLPAALVTSVVRRLEAHGTEVLLVPLPGKSAALPDHLPAGVDPRLDVHTALLGRLGETGAEVLDLLAVLRGEDGEILFCRTDSHWNWEGARRAAEAIAHALGTRVPDGDRISQLKTVREMIDGGDCLDLMGIDVGRLQAEGAYQDWMTRLGDLRRLDFRVAVGPDGVPLVAARVVRRPAKALHVGTSFSAWPGFESMLLHATGGSTDVHADKGGWTTGALKQALARGRAMPPRLSWEFPLHRLFTTARPFDGFPALFLALPDTGLVLLPIPRGGPWFAPNSRLKPGRHRLKSWTAGWVTTDRLVVPGDGILSVRLSGKVVGGIALVQIKLGDHHYVARWKPGVSSITLPLVAGRASGRIRVSMRAVRGVVDLELSSMDLVCDLDQSRAVNATVSPVGTTDGGWRQTATFADPLLAERSCLVIQPRRRTGELRSYDVRCITASGRILTRPTSFGPRSDLVLVDLASLAGETLRSIEVLGRGPAPDGFFEGAAVVPGKHAERD